MGLGGGTKPGVEEGSDDPSGSGEEELPSLLLLPFPFPFVGLEFWMREEEGFGVGVEGMERATEEARERMMEDAREKEVVREWEGVGGGGGARDQPKRAVSRAGREGSVGG